MSNSRSFSRRDFLKISALAAGAAATTRGLTFARPSYAQGTTEISVTLPGRDLEVKYQTAIVDAFNAKMQADGKSVRAKLAPGPATDNDYRTKINLDAASGTLADVVSLQAAQYEDTVAAGYLTDLTPMLTAAKVWDKFVPVIQQQLTVDGKVYALSDASTFTLFYRKDLLSESGIPDTQPNTWDDFYGLCDKIATKTKATPAGLPAARPWGGGTWEEGFRHVWLGFAKSEEIYDPTEKKWVVKSPGLLKALKVYETLAKNKWLTVESLLSPNPWEPIKYQGFPKKTVAIVTGGDWQWEFDWGSKGATPIEGVLEKVGRWQFPSEVSKPFAFTSTGRILGVFSKSPNAQAAFDFINWAFTPEGSCKALESYFGGPSARTDYADSCKFYNTAVAGKMAEAGKSLSTGRFLKAGTGQSKIADGIALATENIITGAKTAEAAMDDFAKRMTDQLGDTAVKTL